MFKHTRARVATLGALALSISAAASAGAAVVSAARPADGIPVGSAHPVHALKAPPPPARVRMALGARHHAGPMATQYTIKDDGQPLRRTFDLSNPTSFNNSGQIAGYAYDTETRTYDCMVFISRVHWVQVNPNRIQNCAPYSMTNADATTGNIEVVGDGSTSGVQGTVPFIATIAGTKARLRALASHDPSALYGINNNAIAVGYSYYRPPHGFFEQYPPFVLIGKKFAPLQPQCTTDQPLCMQNVQQSDFSSYCAFGGCSINDGNVVLGSTYISGTTYEIYNVGQPGSAQTLPIPWGPTYPVGLNNAMQMAYAYYTSGIYSAWQYQVGASAPLSLGTIPGSDCTEFYPLGQNNTGEVLGYADRCVSSSPTYWTWDAVNGMQDLDALIPPNSYSGVTPVGVNDNGQVLVQLQASDGTHWGTLDPSGSAVTHRHNHAR